VLAVGTTGSGKSHLIRSLFLGRPGRRLVIDPTDSELTAIKGAVTFSDPRRRYNDRGEDWRRAATARFVPRNPFDLDAYNALYEWAFEHPPVTVWLDEARMVMPSDGRVPEAALRYQMQGRKRGCSHLVANTRPVAINVELRSEAQHLFVFRLTHRADVKAIADTTGIDVAQVAELLNSLDEHGFLHWCQRDPKTIVRCVAGM